MIYIFHGDNQFESRSALNELISKYTNHDILRLDNKEIDPEKINTFLQSSSLFNSPKLLVLNNFFSTNKSNLDKTVKFLNNSKEFDVIIWQDKNLTAAQLKTFSQAKIETFKLNNQLFACLNAIKPKNLKIFIPLFQKVIKTNLFDLFLYLAKGNLRRQLTNYSRFDQTKLKIAYLQLIELDFQNKTGQLSIPKELALERIFTYLLK